MSGWITSSYTSTGPIPARPGDSNDRVSARPPFRVAGARRNCSTRAIPGYSTDLDRDGDGVACE